MSSGSEQDVVDMAWIMDIVAAAATDKMSLPAPMAMSGPSPAFGNFGQLWANECGRRPERVRCCTFRGTQPGGVKHGGAGQGWRVRRPISRFPSVAGAKQASKGVTKYWASPTPYITTHPPFLSLLHHCLVVTYLDPWTQGVPPPMMPRPCCCPLPRPLPLPAVSPYWYLRQALYTRPHPHQREIQPATWALHCRTPSVAMPDGLLCPMQSTCPTDCGPAKKGILCRQHRRVLIANKTRLIDTYRHLCAPVNQPTKFCENSLHRSFFWCFRNGLIFCKPKNGFLCVF